MFTIEAILADNLRDNQIQTRKVLVLTINDRKNLTSVNSFLTERIPLAESSITHLKRIRSNRDKQCEIIIAAVHDVQDDKDDDSIEQILNNRFDDQKIVDYLKQFDVSDYHIRLVPSLPPLTRPQFENASKYWPTNFHENKYLTKCLNATLFSDDELNLIYSRMQETLNLLKKCDTNNGNRMAALIVKDNRRQLVTNAVSAIETSPLNHATMVAIENVAQIQLAVKSGGGGEKQEFTPEFLEKFHDDYLCTNYDCFLTQEPCLMCAMALVHSRIKRVFFYRDPDPDWVVCDECNDQAYTVHQLHNLTNLNHHYEVWKVSPYEPKLPSQEFPNKKSKSS